MTENARLRQELEVERAERAQDRVEHERQYKQLEATLQAQYEVRLEQQISTLRVQRQCMHLTF